MANFSELKTVIAICREARVPLMIWGTHGQGKSTAVKDAAVDMEIKVVDFRLSTCEAIDLRGFPDKSPDGLSTRFLPPDELPRSGEGILFLDEINRVPDPSVLNAAMTLILDRQLGTYRLPDGYSIVAAGNFEDQDYAVTELDPAFLSRFCQISMKNARGSFQQWKEWCTANHPDVGGLISAFCASNLHYFGPKLTAPKLKIYPCPRSWELAARLLSACRRMKPSKNVSIDVLAGVIGREAAMSLWEFKPVIDPTVLLREGVASQKSLLDLMTREELCNLVWGVAAYSEHHLEETSIVDAVCDFLKYLTRRNREFALAFANEMLSQMESKRNGLSVYRRAALLCNPTLAKLFLKAAAAQGEKHEFLAKLQSEQQLATELAKSASFEQLAS
jgi:hypothetical protein